MAIIKSCDCKSAAAISAFGAYNGTSTGTLTIDSESGVLLTDTHFLRWNSISTGEAALTGAFHYTFELEHRAIQADEVAVASGLVDSINTLQTVRTSVSSQLVQISDATYQDRIYVWYRLGSTGSYLQSNHSENGASVGANKFMRISDKQIDRRYLSPANNIVYAKVVVSVDPANNEISLWINGRKRASMLAQGNYGFDNDSARQLQLGNSSNGIGDGVNNYYLRNIELHNEAYDPVIHDAPVSSGRTIKIGMGIDSFADGAQNPDAEFGAMNELKGQLESFYGINCDLVGGLYQNGQGFYTNGITNAEVDTFLSGNPTDAILFPTVNDLAEGSATWGSGDQSTWEAAVLNVFDRIGSNPTIERIWPLSLWNWLNAAASAGLGGTNARANIHYANPVILNTMNNFFVNIKDNAGLSQAVRDKVQVPIDASSFRGADAEGKGYIEEDTIDSHDSRPVAQAGDLHPSPRYQIAMGRYLAATIAQRVLGEEDAGTVQIGDQSVSITLTAN